MIGIRHEEEFSQILEPKAYYLVLFDFVDVQSPDYIRSSIWEIDPKLPGFAFCMVDYRLNIQTGSASRAPFNLWPYQLKFCLMRPALIYRSTISTVSDSIYTEIFPGRDPSQDHQLEPLEMYSRSQNLTMEKIRLLCRLFGLDEGSPKQTKRDSLRRIQEHIDNSGIAGAEIADKVAMALYYDGIRANISGLPEPLRSRITAISPHD